MCATVEPFMSFIFRSAPERCNSIITSPWLAEAALRAGVQPCSRFVLMVRLRITV